MTVFPTADSRRAEGFRRLRLDQIEPPLDALDITRQPVHSARDIGVIRFEGAEAIPHLADVGLDLGNVAAYRAQVFENQVDGLVRHQAILNTNDRACNRN